MSPQGRLGAVLKECGAAVQVALDTTSLWDALSIASLMPGDANIVFEAGTPLLKSWGVKDSVGALRGVAGPGRAVVADTKTADAGRVEAEIAADAGADALTVIAASHESTIRSAAEAARERGLALYADLMLSRDPLEDSSKALENGADIVLIHLGIDVQQATGATAAGRAGLVRRLASDTGATIAVAGGVKPGEVAELAGAGASIVIIGSAITGSPDPRAAALKALEGLREAGFRCR